MLKLLLLVLGSVQHWDFRCSLVQSKSGAVGREEATRKPRQALQISLTWLSKTVVQRTRKTLSIKKPDALTRQGSVVVCLLPYL